MYKLKLKEKRELKINDVVLIQDDKMTPRNNCRRGKVEELIVSRDSKILGAVLRVYNKKKDSTFLLKLFRVQKYAHLSKIKGITLLKTIMII